ncbi:MAG: hypothetical protein GY765_00585 [bacterium]|nr:hypothetical protein [bacterium]
MNTRLKFINSSDGRCRPDIVLFQKYYESNAPCLPVAWRIIKDCGFDNYHPFDFPSQLYVNINIGGGTHSPMLPAGGGGEFRVSAGRYGPTLQRETGAFSYGGRLALRNELNTGAVEFNVYRAGRLVAVRPAIAPHQVAFIRIKPVLFIATSFRITEGRPIALPIVAGISPRELFLHGVCSADIVMTGGGPGPDATPYAFHLLNVK